MPTRDDFRAVGLTGGPGLARMVPREFSSEEHLPQDDKVGQVDMTIQNHLDDRHVGRHVPTCELCRKRDS